MKRVQIFGDASRMGSDAEVLTELAEAEAEAAAMEAEEAEEAEAEEAHLRICRRDTKNLTLYRA